MKARIPTKAWRLFLTAWISAHCLLYSTQPETADGEPIENALFRGVQLRVDYEGNLYPVVGYENGAFLISVDGEKERIRSDDQLKMKSVLKFSTKAIQVDNLDVRPTASDEQMLYQAVQEYQTQLGEMEDYRNALASSGRGLGLGSPTGQTTGLPVGSVQDRIDQADQEIMQLREQIEDVQTELLDIDERIDSLYITMELTADTLIEDAYIMALAQFTYPDSDSEKPLLNLVFGGIGDLPVGDSRKIHLWMSNFPLDFNVVQMEYHFYSGREEIPSNMTSELFPMDDQEAFEYLYSNYVTNYDGRDRKPQLFKPLDRSLFEGLVPPSQFSDVKLSLTISTLGEITDVQVRGADPAVYRDIADQVKKLRFIPAIEEGVPAETTVSVSLGRVVR